MKLRLTDLAVITGVMLIIGPWLFKIPVNFFVYFGYLVGTVLLSIAGYDAQARMLKRGHPGEDLLQSAWIWIKSLFKIHQDR
jgi:hypothetical protein